MSIFPEGKLLRELDPQQSLTTLSITTLLTILCIMILSLRTLNIIALGITTIEEHILDTDAQRQLSYAATDV